MAFLRIIYHTQIRLWVLSIVIALLFLTTSNAQEKEQVYDQEIKAGLLYNFLKYTAWGSSENKENVQIMVCIFGDDPFEGYLKPMEGRSVNKKIITIRNIYKTTDINNCQMLFVNANQKTNWPKLRNALKGKNILTVSDFKGFADSGGMIEFTKKDGRINVELNIETLKAAQLHVEERLLKLVTIVHAYMQGDQ